MAIAGCWGLMAALQRGAGGGEEAGVGSPAEGQRLVRATREALELAVAPEEAPLAFGLLADIFSDVEPGRPQPQVPHRCIIEGR